MPLGKENYTTFTEIASAFDHNSYHPEWSKTQECDRLINLIFDEALFHTEGETRVNRTLAVARYLGVKREQAAEFFHDLTADVRLPVIFYTLGTSLSRAGEQQIGRCGRFHRALMAVWNESSRVSGFGGSNTDKRAAYQIWLNNVVTQINEDMNFAVPPIVADTTAYQINGGGYVINDGSDITVSAGDRLELVTSGIGFLSVQWQLAGADIAGAVEERLIVDPVVDPDDAGVYTCDYTNANGTTTSNTFTVVIS